MDVEKMVELLRTNGCGCCIFGATDIESCQNDICEFRDAVNQAIEMSKKAEKYRWHDLCKDPNDLPVPLSKNVLILADWGKFCKGQYGLVDYSADGKWCSGIEELDDITVYKWKYEPIDEVE